MIILRSASICGSGTRSQRISCLPCQVGAFIAFSDIQILLRTVEPRLCSPTVKFFPSGCARQETGRSRFSGIWSHHPSSPPYDGDGKSVQSPLRAPLERRNAPRRQQPNMAKGQMFRHERSRDVELDIACAAMRRVRRSLSCAIIRRLVLITSD